LLAHFAQTDLYKTNNKNDTSESKDERSQKENLLELAIKWNCFDQATDLLAELQYTDVSTMLPCTKVIITTYFRNLNS
jgi:hypothetical protein